MSQKKFPILIANKIFNIAVLLLIYFYNQFVASEIRHSTETSLQDLSTINMVFSDKDVISTKSLYLNGYTSMRFTDEFPEKGWTKHGVNKLLKKMRDTGTVNRRPGIGRQRSARTEENANLLPKFPQSATDFVLPIVR